MTWKKCVFQNTIFRQFLWDVICFIEKKKSYKYGGLFDVKLHTDACIKHVPPQSHLDKVALMKGQT